MWISASGADTQIHKRTTLGFGRLNSYFYRQKNSAAQCAPYPYSATFCLLFKIPKCSSPGEMSCTCPPNVHLNVYICLHSAPSTRRGHKNIHTVASAWFSWPGWWHVTPVRLPATGQQLTYFNLEFVFVNRSHSCHSISFTGEKVSNCFSGTR